jgi:hypothetical protein
VVLKKIKKNECFSETQSTIPAKDGAKERPEFKAKTIEMLKNQEVTKFLQNRNQS